MAKRRIGLMTGGGDAPGLNGIIESIVRSLASEEITIVGIQDGFEGIYSGRTRALDRENVWNAHAEAGTLLGTSNKIGTKGREQEFLKAFAALQLDGLIAAGGDGTFEGLSRVIHDLKLIGVPKTIDNDLAGTDVTFGFDTACAVVSEAVDALRATADAHRRVIVVEAMGRTSGWIALGGGLTSYADAILLPEKPIERARLKAYLETLQKKERRGAMIVVGEGAHFEGESRQVALRVAGSPQAERYGGISERIARWVEAETGWESRHIILGHLQRSRHPTTTDRFMTAAMGIEVARMVKEQDWGKAVVMRDGRVTRAPLSDIMKPARLVQDDHRWVEFARTLGLYV
ncbi:MAG: ATP-dependent 6-phosphofructokinase [Bdellovibrionales bacterium]|jgi:6-phosphofructokinase 1|nr:ATP-dependent 6-phosphofructokinase [Bdellovibrionales bacterium]